MEVDELNTPEDSKTEEPEEVANTDELDDSDALSDDDIDEDKLLAEVEELEKELDGNPYIYDHYVKLIDKYFALADLEGLRKSRDNFSAHFPLTESLWMDWITEERPLALSDEDKMDMLKVYEKAVGDYQSLQIWLEYCTFVIGLGDTERCRSVMTRAINDVGYHLIDGKLVWDLFIEYEQAMLAAKQPAPGSCPTESQQQLIEQQTTIISNLYARLICIPLVGIQSALVEYEQWLGESISDELREKHNKAVAVLENCNTFENELAAADNDEVKKETFTKYIRSFITHHPDMTACIKCLYERAIVVGCLDQSLWIQYTTYMEKNASNICKSEEPGDVDNVILTVYKRALRNCPWSGGLWVAYCQYSEKCGATLDSLTGFFESALNSSLTSAYDVHAVWSAYCDSIRRAIDWSNVNDDLLQKLRTTFERAILHLLQYYGEDGDPDCTLPKYWALIEAKHCNNMEKARQVWNDTLTGYRNDKASAWLEYVTFERCYGDHKHCRRVFQRALKAVKDWRESICSEYIRFEREEGTIDQLYVAQARVEEVRKQIAEVEKQQKKSRFDASKGKGQRQQKGKFEKKGAKQQQENKSDGPGPSKGHVKAQSNANKEPMVFQRKRPNSENVSEASSSKKPKLPSSSQSTPVNEFAVPSIPKSAAKQEPSSSTASAGDTPQMDYSNTDNMTVFVSNLSFTTNTDQLHDIFSKCGEIKDVRIMKGKGDKSKGFAYVEFTSSKPVPVALLLDRTEIQGRPMYVSECRKERNQPEQKFKYDVGLEKNKLFVSGLSFNTTQQHLTDAFSKVAPVTSVRLVTYKGGKSKGLAYIEFDNEADAKKALLATDGTVLDGFTMKVAFSNPPARKPAVGVNKDVQQEAPSLGGGRRQHLAEGHSQGQGRTPKLSLMPRAVQKKPASPASTSVTASNAQTEKKPSVETAPPGGKLSNNDFRAMLLSGKK